MVQGNDKFTNTFLKTAPFECVGSEHAVPGAAGLGLAQEEVGWITLGGTGSNLAKSGPGEQVVEPRGKKELN